MSESRPFLTARWIHLLMVNYEVDPAVLAGRVPTGTELDDFAGTTLVSIVGFQFLDTRVLGLPIPFHRNFDEVNLRFYVRRQTQEGPRRGVVFVKEVVPRPAIAWVARMLYNENYVALPMRHSDQIGNGTNPGIAYEWQTRTRAHSLSASILNSAFVPAADSEERFITEHYWGYVRGRDGETLEYRVEHPRWRVWRCSEAQFDCDVADMYGSDFVPYLTATPRSAFVAEGSRVAVFSGRQLDARFARR